MNQDSIGGLWIKQGNKGKFMSGSIKLDGKEYPIIIFKNDKGDNPKRPDYRVFLSQPRNAGQGEARGPSPSSPRTPAHAEASTGQDDFTDDIPF